MNEKMLVKLQQFKEWEKENRRMDKKGLMDIKELPVYLQADVVAVSYTHLDVYKRQ